MTLFEMMSGLSNGGQPGGGYDRNVRRGKGGGVPATPSLPPGGGTTLAPGSRMPGAPGSMDRQMRQGK